MKVDAQWAQQNLHAKCLSIETINGSSSNSRNSNNNGNNSSSSKGSIPAPRLTCPTLIDTNSMTNEISNFRIKMRETCLVGHIPGQLTHPPRRRAWRRAWHTCLGNWFTTRGKFTKNCKETVRSYLMNVNELTEQIM